MMADKADSGEALSLNAVFESPQTMTVGDATQLFAKYKASLQPDLENLASLLRIHRIEQPLANSNYLHALSLTDILLCNVQKSFCMLTGATGDGFIASLMPSVRAMLSRLLAAKGKAQIIIVDGNASELNELMAEFYPVLEVRDAKLRAGAQIAHFIVGDSDMVRDELPHEMLTTASNANQVKANVYFSNHAKAKVFSEKFDAFWKMISPQEKVGK